MRRRMLPGSLEEQHPEEIRRELQGQPSDEGITSSNFAKPNWNPQLSTGTLEIILRNCFSVARSDGTCCLGRRRRRLRQEDDKKAIVVVSFIWEPKVHH